MKKYLYLILFFLVCVPAIAGTINSYTLKSPPDDADTIVIYDSDDGSTKKTTVGDISSGGVAASGWTDGGSNVYLTTSTDSVGMGTHTPSSKLQVVGSVTATTYIGDGSALTGISSGGWSDNGTSVVLATSTDNVGIGSTSPISALDTGNGVITSQSIANDQVYNVKKYGANGDGVTLFDGTITTGTADFTSASATFTSDDVGKVITIIGAGGTNIDLTTTISAFIDSHSITLTDNASASVSSVGFTYGTDDTSAIQSAVDAVYASSKQAGIVFFPQGIYIVNGTFTAANSSQIGLPTVLDSTSKGQQPVIKFLGAIGQKTTSYYRIPTNGTIIYSTRQGSSGNSVISGKNASSSGSFTHVQFEVENIIFRTVQNPVHSVLNLAFVNGAKGKNILCDTAGLNSADIPQPTGSSSYCLIPPGDLNNQVSDWDSIRSRGFYNGIGIGEHMKLHGDSWVLYAVNGVVIQTMTHAAYVGYIGLEGNINNVVCGGVGTVKFDLVDIEHIGVANWYSTTTDIKDTSNNCIVDMTYDITGAGGGSSTIILSSSVAKNWSTRDMNGTTRYLRQAGTSNLFAVNTSANSASSGALLNVVQDTNAQVTAGTRLGGIGYYGAYDADRLLVQGASITAVAAESFTSSASGSYIRFNTANIGSSSPTEKMRVSDNGNIGIGTSNPTSLLQVGATATTAMRFTSSGNLGIGSTAPGATLDIGTGNMRIGIGTTTAGTIVCVKSISSGTSILGYCTGSLTDSICGTCN